MAYRDISGQRFTRLIAKEYLGGGKWSCQCDCGNNTTVAAGHLTNNHTRSCGCLHREIATERRRLNLIGQRFGRLIVIEQLNKDKHNKIHWKCKCDCGNTITPDTGSLTSGNAKSCGCYMRERAREANTTHGLTYTKEYNSVKCLRRRERLVSTLSNWTIDMEETLRTLFPTCCVCSISNNEHLFLHGERLHIDHVKPLLLGNGARPGNVVLLCRNCNAKKSYKKLDDLPSQVANKLRCDALLFKRVWEARSR